MNDFQPAPVTERDSGLILFTMAILFCCWLYKKGQTPTPDVDAVVASDSAVGTMDP